MAQLDQDRIKEIVEAVADRVGGDWLLVGGGLVALWFYNRRVTENIDIVSFSDKTDARYAIMEVAEALGLPIEAVNSPADFFVRRIPDWKKQTEVLYRGREGVIQRPTPTLFLLLKVQRLSEQDFIDCEMLLAEVRKQKLDLDRDRIVRTLEQLLTIDAAGGILSQCQQKKPKTYSRA